MAQQWGQDTVAKFLGGELTLSLSADKSQADYVKDLNGIIERSRNMQPAMLAIGQYLMGSTLRNFRAQGRPRWQPLTAATIADRIRQGFGPGPILQRRGTLMKSLTQPGARGSVLRAGPRSLKYGSNLFYFEFHQKGTGKIPKREMVVLQRQDKSQISRIINTYIRTGKTTTTRIS